MEKMWLLQAVREGLATNPRVGTHSNSSHTSKGNVLSIIFILGYNSPLLKSAEVQ
jgi:hypothetical protein